jgi:hypothetical protein
VGGTLGNEMKQSGEVDLVYFGYSSGIGHKGL